MWQCEGAAPYTDSVISLSQQAEHPTCCICALSSGLKGPLNEVTNGGHNGTPDGVRLTPKMGRQQADVAGHDLW